MGRHGDRTAETRHPEARRPRRGDGTTGGVAIPLIAAALVCLLATSGLWLFNGDDDKDDKPKRSTEAIGLNVPTEEPGPTEAGTSAASAGPGPETLQPVTAKPTSASPSKPPSKSPTPTPSKTTSRPPSSSAPPSASPTPTQSTPTPVTARVDVARSRGAVTITNTTDRPLDTWTLTLDVPDGLWWFDVDSGPADASSDDSTGTAWQTRPLAPGDVVRISFRAWEGTDGATCAFTGGTCEIHAS